MELEDGTPIPEDCIVYTLATNEFVYAGGDGCTMLDKGTGVSRDIMANVVMDWIILEGVISPTTDGRIQALSP